MLEERIGGVGRLDADSSMQFCPAPTVGVGQGHADAAPATNRNAGAIRLIMARRVIAAQRLFVQARWWPHLARFAGAGDQEGRSGAVSPPLMDKCRGNFAGAPKSFLKSFFFFLRPPQLRQQGRHAVEAQGTPSVIDHEHKVCLLVASNAYVQTSAGCGSAILATGRAGHGASTTENFSEEKIGEPSAQVDGPSGNGMPEKDAQGGSTMAEASRGTAPWALLHGGG